MKKIILSLTVAFACISLSAQQAEIDAAKNALNSGNFAEVIAQTQKAEALLKNNRTIEPETVASLYFTAGQAAEKSGDLVKAGEYYAKTSDIENNPFWKAKNKDTKNWEYFYSEADANQLTSAGNYSSPKEESISNSLMSSKNESLSQQAKTALDTGNEAFKAKNYDVASKDFLKAYYLYKAVGNENNLIKYYSAISGLQTDDKQQAANHLQELIDAGFDGVTTTYVATDKASGEEVSFASKADMDTHAKLGLITNPKTETSESMEEELYSNATFAWYAAENFEKALAVGQKGLEKYPNNENMNQIVSSSYLKTGNSEKFVSQIKVKIANGTAKSIDYFNLARSLEDDPNANKAEIIKNYKKAIELDANNKDANLNLAFFILKDEKELVDKMNANLGTTAPEKKIYTENQAKRKTLYQEILPYLEKAYQLDPEDLTTIKFLRSSYEVTGDDDKFFEFKKLYEDKLSQQ